MRVLGVVGLIGVVAVVVARARPAATGSWRLRVGTREYLLGCTAGEVPVLSSEGEELALEETERSGDAVWRNRTYAVHGTVGEGLLKVWERRSLWTTWLPVACTLQIDGIDATAVESPL